MSEKLTKEAFGENLNTNFRVSLGPDQILNLELLTMMEGISTPTQEQFSITFRGPLETPFSQGIRSVEHDTMGSFVLFLVPIARDREGMVYEAVFNRFVDSERND